MEGIAGVTKWPETDGGEPLHAQRSALYTEEINAAVRGAKSAGATEVVVMDCHGAGEGWTFNSLIPDELDPDCEYVVQNEWTEDVEYLEDGVDAALFVGMHAMAGTRDGVLAHTVSGPSHRTTRARRRRSPSTSTPRTTSRSTGTAPASRSRSRGRSSREGTIGGRHGVSSSSSAGVERGVVRRDVNRRQMIEVARPTENARADVVVEVARQGADLQAELGDRPLQLELNAGAARSEGKEQVGPFARQRFGRTFEKE